MTSEIHEFNPVEGGRFRISLTYTEALPDHAGKSTAHTDTFHGVFTRLLPDREVVQEIEFESDDPTMQGTMITTYSLTDTAGGRTLVTGTHEGLPAGVNPADNELGWRMSLGKLARLVEGR